MGNTAGAAMAAIIVVKNLRSMLIDQAKNPKRIELAIEPVRGFFWPREIIRWAETGPINDFLLCLMGVRVNPSVVEEFRQLFRVDIDQTGVNIPDGWGS